MANVGRVGIIQRVLAVYRGPFFERLAQVPSISLTVFAGQPDADEAIRTADRLDAADVFFTTNRTFRTPVGPIYSQSGVLSWLRSFSQKLICSSRSL